VVVIVVMFLRQFLVRTLVELAQTMRP